jgi:hypothetical protein
VITIFPLLTEKSAKGITKQSMNESVYQRRLENKKVKTPLQ